MDERFSHEQLVTGSFVKYDQLDHLISLAYNGSSCTELNIYIDLNSVLKPMYSIDAWSYKYSSHYEIAATIINMCAHYRSYFRRIGVETNIYLIYGLNCPATNLTYVSNYNAKAMYAYNKKPDTTEIINNNLKILSIISQYLPKIYFFDIGTCEVPSMVDYIIQKTNPKSRNIENLIISRDILMLQLVPEQDVRVIRPYKTDKGDESYITWNYNMWNSFILSYRKSELSEAHSIGNQFISNILAMTRIPERNMLSIFSIKKAIKIISTGVSNGYLENNRFYTQASLNPILTAMGVTCNTTELELRYRAINTFYQSNYILPLEKPEFKMLRLVDMEDPQSLKTIISKYFDKTPIDLDRL